MVTKSGKHHYVATLVDYDSHGDVMKRTENFKFTAKDPHKYAADLVKRFTKISDWTTSKLEDLVDLDA